MTALNFIDIATAIKAKLEASATITDVVGTRVYRGKPNADAEYPLIKMHMQASSDDLEMLGGRVFQYFYIAIMAVSLDADAADNLNKAIDALLQRTSLTIGSSQHGNTSRVGTIWFQGDEGENTYTHSGGIYKIGVRS